MAKYELQVKKSVSKDLDPLPKKDVQRIVEAINGLANNPRPPQSLKLSGAEKYRLRCGVYRILYEIQDKVLIVCVVKVGHRKDVYR
ncbi:MAG: type II toxin-antitoxin system mRNA interferase toxin, RelE/StbE family [Verrucomicrobia bacterium]|nr:type II toxin-antitoxin system mRNA interferase toxin, RelE/StbE family [Verrucomicrobiota bacterium]